MSWLFKRLSEEMQQNNVFVFLTCAHWVRGLALLCEENEGLLSGFYSKVKRKTPDDSADTQVFIQLVMSMHFASALKEMNNSKRDQIFSRIAIISWYYGIMYAAKAMISATDSSNQSNHSKVANEWDKKISSKGLALPPFGLRVSTLVQENYKSELSQMQGYKKYHNKEPKTNEVACGACCSRLERTADTCREKEECRIKYLKEFKEKGFTNFRKKEARKIRDSLLAKKSCGFLHEAYRFRIKPNYRDVPFLIYPKDTSRQFSQLLDDLDKTLEFFIEMALYYCRARTKKDLFDAFIEDISKDDLFESLKETTTKFI